MPGATAAGLLLTAAAPLTTGAVLEQEAAAARCAAFASATFGEQVRLTATRHVPAAASRQGPNAAAVTLPSHCLVSGVIGEREGAGGKKYGIGFELALPDRWSGRFLLQGGGGLNGSVRPPTGPVAAGDRPALARGFAVVSHDSGHTGAVFDDSFLVDQRAALDFAEASVRTVTLLAKEMTRAYFDAPIARSYMTGCSTGGREGMLAAQRYPELFDGIIVGAPAMRTGNSNLAIEYASVQFNQAAPRDAEGLPLVERIFSPADRKTLLGGMLEQCDALDGLADGMIANVAGCRFEPRRLQCTAGKAENCLSPAQVGALERAFAGPKDSAGYPLYAPVPYDTGIVETEGPIPGYLPTGRPGVFGPASRALEIDLDSRANALRNTAWQRLTDTNYWTNLNTFLGRGGKILFFHGVSDPWFSAFDTWDYWQRAAETNGAAWDNASRFYMNPGMPHCSGGNAHDQFDLLTPLVDWVEKAEAPGPPVSRRASDPQDQRPLCAYPSYPHYIGGKRTEATSFECRRSVQ
nr:tannase/feruloyl esterase family alpha/beta hydrolase [Croceibacterium soli]